MVSYFIYVGVSASVGEAVVVVDSQLLMGVGKISEKREGRH